MAETITSGTGAENTSKLFDPNVPEIPPAFTKFFTSYTDIQNAADLPAHLLALRDSAYTTVRYPCLGLWRFLQLDLATHPRYNDIVGLLAADLSNPSSSSPAVSSSKTSSPRTAFLDLGCCLGQDLRKLIWDVSTTTAAGKNAGPPTGSPHLNSNVYGADLQTKFIDIGYDLFRDEATLPRSQFISPANVLDDSPNAPLTLLDGKISIVNCISFFHLFDWDEQIKVAHRILRLFNPEGFSTKLPSSSSSTTGTTSKNDGGGGGPDEKRKQALVVGSQLAAVTPGHYQRLANQKTRYAHNEESWERLWKEAISVDAAPDSMKEVVKKVKDVRVWSELINMRRFASTFNQVPVGPEASAELISKMDGGARIQRFTVWVDFQ